MSKETLYALSGIVDELRAIRQRLPDPTGVGSCLNEQTDRTADQLAKIASRLDDLHHTQENLIAAICYTAAAIVIAHRYPQLFPKPYIAQFSEHLLQLATGRGQVAT